MISRLLQLNQLLRPSQSAFLFGPRGVGKTLLIKEYAESLSYCFTVDFLSVETLMRYMADPGLFRSEIIEAIPKKGVLGVIIDEVQLFPRILNEVHSLLESYKGRIHFVLTGSSARKLKRSDANLLAGRAWTLYLHPFSSFETKLNLNRALQFGTLPAIYLESGTTQGAIKAKRSLRAYIETYLKEEIMQESLVRRVDSFVRFLDIAGQFNAEPVNFSKIGRLCGVSGNTVQEYFSILVDTLIAFRVDGWSFSVRKQLLQAPKYYLFDCGVLNAIRGELSLDLKAQSYRYGRLFETFLVNEIRRLNDYKEKGYRFFYWRTNAGSEVDLILSRGPSDAPIAIEFKSSSMPGDSDLQGLKSFASENPAAKLYCFCRCPKPYKKGAISVVPWQEGLERLC